MKLQQDFYDMIQLLVSEEVQFVLVGAFAMAHFGYVRATGDIDLFVNATHLNSIKLMAALKKFGTSLFGIQEDYFSHFGNFLQLGLPPNRINLISKIDGVDFNTALSSAVNLTIDQVTLSSMSLENLIKNKVAAGRPKDIPDVIELRKLLEAKYNGPK